MRTSVFTGEDSARKIKNRARKKIISIISSSFRSSFRKMHLFGSSFKLECKKIFLKKFIIHTTLIV